MEIKRMEVKLESVCPLLMDKFDMGKSNPKTEEDYIREAEKKVYKDSKGNIGIQASSIKACIRESSSELGMKREGKKNRQMIRAGVFFEQEIISINKKNYDLMRKDIVTRGKGDKVTRVTTFRPQFNEWSLIATINLVGVNPEFIVQCLELGGLKYGIGGYRPEFGRFILKSWRLIK